MDLVVGKLYLLTDETLSFWKVSGPYMSVVSKYFDFNTPLMYTGKAKASFIDNSAKCFLAPDGISYYSWASHDEQFKEFVVDGRHQQQERE